MFPPFSSLFLPPSTSPTHLFDQTHSRSHPTYQETSLTPNSKSSSGQLNAKHRELLELQARAQRRLKSSRANFEDGVKAAKEVKRDLEWTQRKVTLVAPFPKPSPTKRSQSSPRRIWPLLKQRLIVKTDLSSQKPSARTPSACGEQRGSTGTRSTKSLPLKPPVFCATGAAFVQAFWGGSFHSSILTTS